MLCRLHVKEQYNFTYLQCKLSISNMRFPFLTGASLRMPHERVESWFFGFATCWESLRAPPSECVSCNSPGWSANSFARPLVKVAVKWVCMICVRCCWGFFGWSWSWRIVSSWIERGQMLTLSVAGVYACALTSRRWGERWAWSRLGRRSSGRISASGWLILWHRRCPMCLRQCAEKHLWRRKSLLFQAIPECTATETLLVYKLVSDGLCRTYRFVYIKRHK